MPEGKPATSSEKPKPFEVTPDTVREYLSKRMNAVHSAHYDPSIPMSKVMSGVEDVIRGDDKDAAQEMARAIIDGIENQYRGVGGPQGTELNDLRALTVKDALEWGIKEEVFEAYWNEKYPEATEA